MNQKIKSYMQFKSENEILLFYKKMSFFFAAVVFLFSSASLIGWFFEIPQFRSLSTELASMKVNTALSFLASGLLFLTRPISIDKKIESYKIFEIILILIPLGIGLITLAEYIFEINTGLDHLFHLQSTEHQKIPFPGRMSPATAFGIAVIGLSNLFVFLNLKSKNNYISIAIIFLFSFSISMIASYIYKAEALYQTYYFKSVALNSSLCFLSCGFILLFSHPELKIMKPFTSMTLGGILIRKIFPWVMLVPFAIGWVRLIGERKGLYGTEMGLVIMVLSTTLIFCSALWIGAEMIDKIDTEKNKANLQFAIVIDAAPSSMILVNKEGQIVFANSQTEKYFGYSKEELHTKPVEKLIPPKFRQNHKQYRSDYTTKSEARAMGQGRDLFGLRKDGSEFPVEVGLNPIKIDNETLILAVIVDITSRKLAETLLRENEIKLKQLADSMPQIVWTNNEIGETDFINKKWYEYTGLETESFYDQQKRFSVIHPDDVLPSLEQWQKAFKQGQEFQFEYRIRGQDQEYRWFLGRVVALRDDKNEINRWIGTATDIHEFKMAQEKISKFNTELEQKILERTLDLKNAIQSLEAVNKELDSFTYSVSHDLRAPLRSIDGFSKILLEDFSADLPSSAQNYLQRVRSNTLKMGILVDDLLTFSRLGRHPIKNTLIDSQKLASAVVEDLMEGQSYPKTTVEFINPLEPCLGDEILVRQIWVNFTAVRFKS